MRNGRQFTIRNPQESASYFDGELFGDHATDIPEIFCLKINTKENEHVE
jgi:hypothetical protein